MKGSRGLYALATLGCRVNQAESAALALALEAQGWSPAPEGSAADLVVLMTCSVTGSAARQSRQMVRRLTAAHPGSRLVATGCDAQVQPRSYLDQGAVVLGRGRLGELTDLAQSGAWPQGEPEPPGGPWLPGMLHPLTQRTRAMLKVQDGCDAHCAYCVVPRARGGPRSLPLERAVAAYRDLARASAAEVVLTGIHLGRWGQDLDPPVPFAHLIRALLAAADTTRIRLSSLEAGEVTPELVALAGREPRLCRHFHLPLQSGSPEVLAAMGRPGTVEHYAEVVTDLRQTLPGVSLGADVLVGLPGEGEAQFTETLELIRRLPLSYLHVFPYSPRPGTRAAAMPGRPPSAEAKRRAAVLRKLGREKSLAFHQTQVGQTLEAVVEQPGLARTDNYCLAEVPPELPRGTMVRLDITGHRRGDSGLVLTTTMRDQ